MSEKTPSVEKPEKQLRVLEKKLERSERHRADLEDQHDRGQHLLRQLHAEVEAARREAKIEAALERVRARAMAMHHSGELREVIATVYEQFRILGFADWGYALVTREDNTGNAWDIWMTLTEELALPEAIRVPYLDDPIQQGFFKAWEQENSYQIYEFGGLEKRNLDRRYFTETAWKDVPETIKDSMRAVEHVVCCMAVMRHSVLEVMGPVPIPEDKAIILQRFARVFEQTYTRFLDLKQAEEQAREAQIEASLERVRARAIGMHSSDDLSDATAIVFAELERLGIVTLRCGIIIIRETRYMDTWTATATSEGKDLRIIGRIDTTIHPLLEGVLEAWKAQQPYYVYELVGEDMQAYYQAIAREAAYPLPEQRQPSQRQFCYTFFFPEGALFAFIEHPLPEESIQIFNRFAAVFAQTYRRYLDLKKAEAQAREAQIEAALERVRSRTMAMQGSDELAEAASVAFRQLKALDVVTEADRFSFGIFDVVNGDHKLWITEPGGTVITRNFTLPLDTAHGPFAANYRAWLGTPPAKRKELVFVDEFAGQSLVDYLAFIVEHTDLADDKTVQRLRVAPASDIRRFAYTACFSHGSLHVLGPHDLEAEALEILKRFARVFEQTYVRFVDLQQAEVRAREATRQASLDRVRAEIASMRTTADLERITPLVWRELTTLGVPFFRCGVFIIDEAAETVQVFLTNPEGKALAALDLGFDDAPLVTATVVHWRQGAVYTEEWDAAQMRDWTQFLQERGLIETSTRYLDAEAPPEHLALHFVPFEQGMLYVGSTAPLAEEEVELVQVLADAFAIAYARYEDFQRLEAKNREVEAAMDELKATQQQLVQSEKMASLGALTAGIAHEIKNPLNFVNNFAALSQDLVDELEEETDPEEIQAILADLKTNAAKIEEHGKRADSIVRSMMQHARTGSGERESVMLNNFVDEYVDLSWHGKRAQTPSFDASIVRDYGKAVGLVELVPQDLGRVLINLLSNAFDAVYERTVQANGQYAPQVTISTQRVGNSVEIQVTDNGSGIPPEVQARIFEPFFTTKPTGSGTGLGLSLSYDIITQGHGGTLTVESVEGQGAAFMIRIPD